MTTPRPDRGNHSLVVVFTPTFNLVPRRGCKHCYKVVLQKSDDVIKDHDINRYYCQY